MLKVTLPSGTVVEFPDNNSVEQIRAVISSLGVENVANAPAVKEGQNVTFSAPQGGTKGL